nr:tRNA (guanine-N(7)-)-methyltransferase [Ipomoea batatas]
MALSMMYSVVPRRVLSTVYTGEFTIHSLGKLPSLTISPHPRPCSRCYCRSFAATASPAGVSSSVAEIERQVISSTELVAMEYAELNLTDKFCEELGRLRIRQHVNPLRSSLLKVPAEVPNWNEVYKDTSLPLVVDIGSGSGRFLMYLAKRNPESKNYLGLEIRPKLVTRAMYWVNELGLRNIHFMFANATISFERIVSTYPGPLALVSILCPDPHFKKKHHKRRVVQKPLAQSIVDRLARGGQVFIQSDVLEVALDMRDYFDTMSNELIHIDNINPNVLCDSNGWVLKNPMGIRTEREIHAEFEGSSIYRRVYEKVQR